MNEPKTTGFVNLDRYLTANQGSNVGNRLASNINNLASGTQNLYGSLVNKFNTQSNANLGDATKRQAELEKVTNNPGLINYNDTAQNNPYIQEFSNWRSGQYKGPQSLSDVGNFDKLQQQGNSLNNVGKLMNSYGGRQTLLQNYIGGGKNYNQGAQALDTILTANNPALNKINVSSIANKANKAEEQARATANINALKQKQFAADTQKRLEDLYNPLMDPTTGKLAKQNKDFNDAQTIAFNEFVKQHTSANPYVTNDASIGIAAPTQRPTSGIGRLPQLRGTVPSYYTFGVDPLEKAGNGYKYVDSTPQSTSSWETATPEQRAQAIALSKLSGKDVTGLDPNANYIDPSKPQTQYNFKPTLSGDIQQKQAEYQNQTSPIMAEIKQILAANPHQGSVTAKPGAWNPAIANALAPRLEALQKLNSVYGVGNAFNKVPEITGYDPNGYAIYG